MRFKKISFFLLSFFIFHFSFAQVGKVIEQKTVRSNVMGRDVKYSIYLPPDYEKSERTYPVVYLLHGFTDDNTGWLQFGEVNRFADKAISDGTISPMIIVMPNADSSWYINSYDGKENYEDFFVKEFMPAIEKAYRIKSDKKYRGIAGLSMGGYGTMIYALKHPDLFAAAAPLSSGVLSDDELVAMPDGNYNAVFAPVLGRDLKGKDRLAKTWNDNSVLGLVAAKKPEDLRKVRYWIDCGDDDFLIKGNCLLHIALREKDVAHEFRVRDGVHNWTYWRTGIVDALAFISDSFRQK